MLQYTRFSKRTETFAMERTLAARAAILPAEASHLYEQFLATKPGVRKAAGAYYTPQTVVESVVQHTLGPLFRGKTPKDVARFRIVDPACGTGVFLIQAYRLLLDWYGRQARPRVKTRLPAGLRRHILLHNLYGVDLDAGAVRIARAVLQQEAGLLKLDLSHTIRHGNALVDSDFPRAKLPLNWQEVFPEAAGGFDAVLGNPPWGQKAIRVEEDMKRYLWQRYPSSAGIFDLFRPFVELGVRLTRDGGRFGMVLPDIVLLKDYPQTRRYLLDQLTLERIDWRGKAFAGAEMDVATVIGRKGAAPANQKVAVTVHDRTAPLCHTIRQSDFEANPRCTFNLRLTAPRRRLLAQLANGPRLGDWFEIHEGVHSGNIRAELFLREKRDSSCRPLYFGRDEIASYRLRWSGWHIRLRALPARKTWQRYANLGQPEWHEREKLLVRRTGDRVLAAVDQEGRYASNNFFLIFPRQPGPLDLHGLCALLNSRFMTWYFRVVEPRQGRAFAELKIKHLRSFPVPGQAAGCRRLNDLGAKRRHDETIDDVIEAEVLHLFGLEATDVE
jgi:hypothetical protein